MNDAKCYTITSLIPKFALHGYSWLLLYFWSFSFQQQRLLETTSAYLFFASTFWRKRGILILQQIGIPSQCWRGMPKGARDMLINEQLEKQNMTKYRLSKESGVPQATINDICSRKIELDKYAAGTLYRCTSGKNKSGCWYVSAKCWGIPL